MSSTTPTTVDDGLDFEDYIKPPAVPPDPTGEDWRGPTGPQGPPGPGAAPSDTVPIMNGTGAAGTAGTASRGDHVHPTDTSRYAASNPSGFISAAALAPYAPLASPTFTGTPSLPTGTAGITQTAGSSTTAIATTAFVTNAVSAATAGVASFNTRTGAVTLQAADVTGVGGALLAAPVFTGDARAVTAATGDNDTSIATTAFVQAAVAPALNDVGRNKLHNGGFRINQRTYVSGTALAAAAYAHDRWKAGAGGCTYTFTQAQPATTITITAGTLQQIVEALDVMGGTYTLSWTGTANGRVNAGGYAASPITVTSLAANTAITVEFQTGTVGTVQLEQGTVATAYERSGMRIDLANCQRFYQVRSTVVTGGVASGAGAAYVTYPHAVVMRATPTIVLGTPSYSNCSALATWNNGIDQLSLSLNVTGAGAYFAFAGYTASADL